MANAVERMFNGYLRAKKEIDMIDHESYQYIQVSDSVTGSMTEFPYLKRRYVIRGVAPVITLGVGSILDERRKGLERKRAKVFDHLNGMSDRSLAELLMLRYVVGFSWKSVAGSNGGGLDVESAKAAVAGYFKGFD